MAGAIAGWGVYPRARKLVIFRLRWWVVFLRVQHEHDGHEKPRYGEPSGACSPTLRAVGDLLAGRFVGEPHRSRKADGLQRPGCQPPQEFGKADLVEFR